MSDPGEAVELDRCPFCGGEAKIHAAGWPGMARIVCTGCGVETELMAPHNAIAAWHRRASSPHRGAAEGAEACVAELIESFPMGMPDQFRRILAKHFPPAPGATPTVTSEGETERAEVDALLVALSKDLAMASSGEQRSGAECVGYVEVHDLQNALFALAKLKARLASPVVTGAVPAVPVDGERLAKMMDAMRTPLEGDYADYVRDGLPDHPRAVALAYRIADLRTIAQIVRGSGGQDGTDAEAFVFELEFTVGKVRWAMTLRALDLPPNVEDAKASYAELADRLAALRSPAAEKAAAGGTEGLDSLHRVVLEAVEYFGDAETDDFENGLRERIREWLASEKAAPPSDTGDGRP